MFSLVRLDVFPHDDLGIPMALKNLYASRSCMTKRPATNIARLSAALR